MASLFHHLLHPRILPFLFTLSRWDRDLYTIHENTTVSPAHLCLQVLTCNSRYSSAPLLPDTPAHRDNVRYRHLFFGTANKNPSTYAM